MSYDLLYRDDLRTIELQQDDSVEELVICVFNGPDDPISITSWLPSPQELEAIKAKSPLTVHVGDRTSALVRVVVG